MFSTALYMALLFFVLTPGILVHLPRRGSKLVVALTHGLAFAAIFYLTHKFVRRAEGFQDTNMPNSNAPSVAIPTPPPTTGPNIIPVSSAPPTGPTPAEGPTVSLAPINISLSISGSGKPGTPCKTGNDCAKGICLSNMCV